MVYCLLAGRLMGPGTGKIYYPLYVVQTGSGANAVSYQWIAG
jgi:hypothetical protein